MAAVDQPLNLGTQLEASLRGLQGYLDAHPLSAKINFQYAPLAPGMPEMEASMDRTLADAKEVARRTGVAPGVLPGTVPGGILPGVLPGAIPGIIPGLPPGSMPGGIPGMFPGNPGGLLGAGANDPINRLIKALDLLTAKVDKLPGSRRPRTPDSTDTAPLPEEQNLTPNIIRGLLTNPFGTLAGLGQQMLSNRIFTSLTGRPARRQRGGGGGGGGILAGGIGEEESVSGILPAAEIGIGVSAGEAGIERQMAGMSLNAAIGTAAWGTVGAGGAILAYYRLMSEANDRQRDAMNYLADLRMGRNVGVNWREGAWVDRLASRRDIPLAEAQEVMASSGVSWLNFAGGAMGRTGNWNRVTLAGEAANAATNLGISPSQMGGLLGAEARSGAMNDTDAVKRYLSMIENWTGMQAKYGLSSSESLTELAEISKRASSGTYAMTMVAQARGEAIQAFLRNGLPQDEMSKEGMKRFAQELGAPAKNDTERVMLLNTLMDRNQQLTPEGRRIVQDALGGTYKTIQRTLGNGPGTDLFLAQEALASGLGLTEMRMAEARQFQAKGINPGVAAQEMGISLSTYSAIVQAIEHGQGTTEDRARILLHEHPIEKKGTPEEIAEQGLAQLNQAMIRLSGVSNTAAKNLEDFSLDFAKWRKQFTGSTENFLGDIYHGLFPPKSEKINIPWLSPGAR